MELPNAETVWKAIVVWAVASTIILANAGERGVVLFVAGFAGIFGYGAYRIRHRVRPFLAGYGISGFSGYLLLGLSVSAGEEIFCSLSGNRIAHPVLWVDLVLVLTLWSVWFGTWWFVLAPGFAFREHEALLAAASTGILYEYAGTGAILSNPGGIVILAPVAVVVYAAIMVLPMQLIDFTGSARGWKMYMTGVFLPFLLTIPVALGMFGMLSVLKVL